MANIINPVLPTGGGELSVEHARGGQQSGNKFADHLDRRIDNSRERNQEQLGVRNARRDRDVQAERAAEAGARPGQKKSGKTAEEQGDIANLILFLQDLQQVAQDKSLGPGEWSVALPEAEILADLAQQAGMSQADLTALVEQFQGDNGELDLDAFFQALIDHFVAFEPNPAIVVPETELPLLESLLAKMGLSAEQLETISSQAVAGDGEIDLARLGQALDQLNIKPQTLQTVPLTEWEAEQLQALLAKAGVTLGDQLDLLPEQVFGEEMQLNFERLQTLLKEAVALAKDSQPKLDLPQFLGSLEQVMRQAAFQKQSAGWSPVLQDSQGEAYQDLLGMYDQARLRYEEDLSAEEDQLESDIRKWLDSVVARAAERAGKVGTGAEGDQQKFEIKDILSAENIVPLSREEFAGQPHHDGLVSGQVATSDQNMAAPTPQAQPLVRQVPMQQQQQILNQLSLAVARGMRSGEQHLVLKLHPADLGEVKVDLTVRHEVVSVSFTMENNKVKETLESSMQEFRQNMEQKGFSLSDVNVFVGQNNDEPGDRQRFEVAWSGERLQAQNLGDIPEDVLYHTAAHGGQHVSPEDGVNLFV